MNKSASHLSSLNYAGFNWTADKAVDGCLLRDDPDTQQCCSCSEGAGTDNFWRVDLGQQYTVNDIVIYGRQPAGTLHRRLGSVERIWPEFDLLHFFMLSILHFYITE